MSAKPLLAIPTPPMAEAARWLEWQGRDAVARTAAVALGAGAAAATAGAFIHAAFTPGANRWLRVPEVTTTRYLTHAQQSHTTATAQPLGPVTAVACRLIALTAQLRPQPLPLKELHGPDDGECDADVLVEAALATPGLRLRVLRLGIHVLLPHVALDALAAWGPAGLIEWDAEVRFPPFNVTDDPVMKSVARAFGVCTALRVLRSDDLHVPHLPPLPSVRVATVIRKQNAPVEIATIATLFPQLEHLHTGPARAGPDEEWSTFFTTMPSLTRISWCQPRCGVWPQEADTGPHAVPAPQARLVPPPHTPTASYAALYPGVEELQMVRNSFVDTAMPMICALTHLRVLTITAQGYFQYVRHCRGMLFKKHPRSVPADAHIALMLASLPLLEVLDLSVYNGRNPHLTFATADYDGVVAPRLRTLKAAGAALLRGAGLRALARVCPNLRHLDVRAAFAMSREEFIDGLLELSPAPAAAAATAMPSGTEPQKPVHRLRLPKLRRLYSTFRRRLPKALNFNTYCSGWTHMRCDTTERPMDVRDAELQPPIEPEHVVVYFNPRRNKRRLSMLPNNGIDVHVRIEDAVPGEFAPRPERKRRTVDD